jgi:uncharacterized protein YcaQ
MSQSIERAEEEPKAATPKKSQNAKPINRSHVAELALTIEEARGVTLAAQRLEGLGEAGAPSLPGPTTTAEDMAALIEALGVLQIDTINVAERSQYLVLWSRLGAYKRNLLDQLLYPRRAIFEYWSHAASILPMQDYRWYRQDMLRSRERVWSESDHWWITTNPQVITETLERIRTAGPMASADFERPTDVRSVERWDWYGAKESRRALEILWLDGDLMIHSRRGGQKVYDVRERVLAEAFTARGASVPSDDELPTAHERLDFFAQRTARALGVVTPSWLWDYFRQHTGDMRDHPHAGSGSLSARAASILDELARGGGLVPVTIEDVKEPAWMAVESLATLERLRAGATPERTTLLSPFDNLIWHRRRARDLFGYEVKFEVYIVPEKRKYGYYNLAILHRGRLVGQLDPKMDRKEGRLIIHLLSLEPGIRTSADLLNGVAEAIRDLAAFLGAGDITIENAPAAILKGLNKRLG